MHKRITAGVTLALLAIVWMAMGTSPVGADDEDVPWDKSFNGHEMWQTSLDDGLKMAGEMNRHLLIDIYSRG
ncbi:MAG: hypothetical protein Kow0074_11470 [Candidatus Zixiibacteriota bacterium]